MWPVMVFFTNSTIHMLAHSAWAQAMMLAGGAELGLAKGKLKSEWWRLCVPLAFAVSGAAFLIHEANPWLTRARRSSSRVRLDSARRRAFPLGAAFKPRSLRLQHRLRDGFAATAVALYTSRDVAPIFGHLDPSAGVEHR